MSDQTAPEQAAAATVTEDQKAAAKAAAKAIAAALAQKMAQARQDALHAQARASAQQVAAKIVERLASAVAPEQAAAEKPAAPEPEFKTAHVFSPTTAAFYPVKLRAMYEQAGSWPADAVEIEDDEFKKWLRPPPGKVRAANAQGMPAWADHPPVAQPAPSADAPAKRSDMVTLAGQVTELRDQIAALAAAKP